MWDLPRPGIEAMSPALAGRFFTTEPPGKPKKLFKLRLIQISHTVFDRRTRLVMCVEAGLLQGPPPIPPSPCGHAALPTTSLSVSSLLESELLVI